MRSGLDEADFGILKIADPVDDGVHCPVSSQNDQAALLAPRREIFADVFYFVLRGRVVYFVRHPALLEQGLYFVPLALAAAGTACRINYHMKHNCLRIFLFYAKILPNILPHSPISLAYFTEPFLCIYGMMCL